MIIVFKHGATDQDIALIERHVHPGPRSGRLCRHCARHRCTRITGRKIHARLLKLVADFLAADVIKSG